MKATSGAPREIRNTDAEEIREHGFERFIRNHIENTHMAFDAKFYKEHPEAVQALSDALWKRQTSPEQHQFHYEARRTWGHSTWEEGVRLCDAAGARQLVLFHHDPERDDDALDAIAAELEATRPGSIVAREGMVLTP